MPFLTYESFLVHATYHTWSSLGLSFFFNKNVIYIIFDQKKKKNRKKLRGRENSCCLFCLLSLSLQ